MPRYVAFLRGVSPMNARMPELKRCFEAAGFTEVKTVLSSGNVVFDSRASKAGTLERRAQEAMQQALGRSFATMVRSVASLQAMLASEPFDGFELAPQSKCVVTFLRAANAAHPALPIERGDARVLKVQGAEVFSAYVPSDKGPVFMQLLERTFGKDITTRTLDTVRKCAAA